MSKSYIGKYFLKFTHFDKIYTNILNTVYSYSTFGCNTFNA